MSIYASIFGFGHEHERYCATMRKLGPKYYEQDDAKQCTCGSSPLIYQGSHVLPSDKDKNGGTLGLAAIPGHIRRSGRDALSGDMHPYHPWLRVSFDGVKDDAVILTRKQVQELQKALTDWLEFSKPRKKGKRN